MAEQLHVVSPEDEQGQTEGADKHTCHALWLILFWAACSQALVFGYAGANRTLDGPTMQGIAKDLFGWELAEEDVKILKKPNGRPIVLGEGGYGKVRHP